MIRYPVFLKLRRHRKIAEIILPQLRLLKYSDDQPRDDSGRWTDGGGGADGGGDNSDGTAKPARTIEEHRADRAYSTEVAVENLKKLPQFEIGKDANIDPAEAALMREKYRMNGVEIIGKPVAAGGYTDRTEEVEAAFHALDFNSTVRTAEVRINSLVTYQRYVMPKVFLYARDMEAIQKDAVAVVMRYGGKNWLMDGNHRVNALKAGGTKVIKVKFLNADKQP
jgi:hypothetical protein